jgi:hypothetical protein
MAKTKSASKTKSAAKKVAEAKPQTSPLLDSAAAAAAAMVGNKIPLPDAGHSPRTETSNFRQLKESLSKPHSQTMGNLLDKISSTGQKRSSLPFGGGKQVGHNQTFGADVNRRNVPRRTGG